MCAIIIKVARNEIVFWKLRSLYTAKSVEFNNKLGFLGVKL